MANMMNDTVVTTVNTTIKEVDTMTNTTTTTATVEKKATKRELFNRLLTIEAVFTDSALVDFINHELELLDKKRSSTGKTAENKAKADAPIKSAIVEVLTSENRPMTVTEIIASSTVQASSESGVSSSKATAMLKKLMADDIVVRTEEKKKAYFSIKLSY